MTVLVPERQRLILEKLTADGKVLVSDLCELFDVSDETIRRDLEKLEDQGYAIKSYGGAVLNENVGADTPMNIRSKKNVGAKQKIASIASMLIQNGDHVTLDASSTALFIAQNIQQVKNLHILTNSIEILMELSNMPSWEVTATAGNVLEGFMALVGPKAENSIRSFYMDKAFISCRALSYEFGIMDAQESMSQTRQAILDCTKKTYLVADHSKFDGTSFAKTSTLDRLAGIITDEKPDARWLRLFRKTGINCYYPGHLPAVIRKKSG